MEQKQCSICKLTKSISNFGVHNIIVGTWKGSYLHSDCKECHALKSLEYLCKEDGRDFELAKLKRAEQKKVPVVKKIPH